VPRRRSAALRQDKARGWAGLGTARLQAHYSWCAPHNMCGRYPSGSRRPHDGQWPPAVGAVSAWTVAQCEHREPWPRAHPSPVRARISSRSNSAKPPSTVRIRQRGVVVPEQTSAKDRNPAPRRWRASRGRSSPMWWTCATRFRLPAINSPGGRKRCSWRANDQVVGTVPPTSLASSPDDIRVTSPNGSVISFPKGTSAETVGVALVLIGRGTAPRSRLPRAPGRARASSLRACDSSFVPRRFRRPEPDDPLSEERNDGRRAAPNRRLRGRSDQHRQSAQERRTEFKSRCGRRTGRRPTCVGRSDHELLAHLSRKSPAKTALRTLLNPESEAHASKIHSNWQFGGRALSLAAGATVRMNGAPVPAA
jgi:hypothetical protein